MGYLILMILPILIPTAFSQESDLLDKICTNSSQNYTKGSFFAENLKYLLDDLVLNTPHYLFWKEKWGRQGPFQSAYGLALCRGDVTPDDCDFCLYDAKCKITQRCYKKSAIVWYDYCQLKYSDVNFFGQIDTDNENIWINYYNRTNRTEEFRTESLGLLSNLSDEASKTTNKYMFASGETLFDEQEDVTIYGMAQCTRDLSPDVCKTCLDNATKKLPIYDRTDYSVGGRVFGGSCTVRYETYAFLNDNKARAKLII